MNQKKINFDILQQVFPGECAIIGEEKVEQIAEGGIQLIKTEGGSNFDLSTIISLLILTSSTITTTINVINFLKKKGTDPTIDNIKKNTEIPDSELNQIPEEKLQEIYLILIERMKDE